MQFSFFSVGAVPKKVIVHQDFIASNQKKQVLSQVSYANVISEVSEFKEQVSKAFCSLADMFFLLIKFQENEESSAFSTEKHSLS